MSPGRMRDARRAGIGQWLFALIVIVVVPAAVGASLARHNAVRHRTALPALKHEPIREYYGDPKGTPLRTPLQPMPGRSLDIPIAPPAPIDTGPPAPSRRRDAR